MLPEVQILRIVAAGLVTVDIQAVDADLLQLRVAAAFGDTQLCAGFEDSQACDFQTAVARIGLADQAIKHRVNEDLPPLAQIGMGGAFTGLFQGRAVPLFAPCFGGRLEIRPQAHATAHTQDTEQ